MNVKAGQKLNRRETSRRNGPSFYKAKFAVKTDQIFSAGPGQPKYQGRNRPPYQPRLAGGGTLNHYEADPIVTKKHCLRTPYPDCMPPEIIAKEKMRAHRVTLGKVCG